MPERSALLSGAASGLGLATALAFAAEGYRVTMFDMVDDPADASASLIEAGHSFVSGDARNEEDVQRAVDTACRQAPLRVVVNCAGGGGVPSRLVRRDGSAHPLDLFESRLGTNLTGTFNFLRLGAVAMAQNDELDGERGVIINTASTAAFEGQIGQVAYAAAKGAVVSMTLPASRELSQHRVRVVTIAPGFFDTPRTRSFGIDKFQGLLDPAQHPARPGMADEFALLALHIAGNQMINGTTIRIDAGARAAAR